MFLTRNITSQTKKKALDKGIKAGFRVGIMAVTEGSGYKHCTGAFSSQSSSAGNTVLSLTCHCRNRGSERLGHLLELPQLRNNKVWIGAHIGQISKLMSCPRYCLKDKYVRQHVE